MSTTEILLNIVKTILTSASSEMNDKLMELHGILMKKEPRTAEHYGNPGLVDALFSSQGATQDAVVLNRELLHSLCSAFYFAGVHDADNPYSTE